MFLCFYSNCYIFQEEQLEKMNSELEKERKARQQAEDTVSEN